MRIYGHLLNAAQPDKNDVFDGYTVEIRYFARAHRGDSPTYKEIEDVWTCRGRDNSFAFELLVPDIAFDKDLHIKVRSPHGLEVFSKTLSLATVVRSEEPLDLSIQRIEPPPAATPLSLRGRLVWRDEPGDTKGFSGFNVVARFNAREAAGNADAYMLRFLSIPLTDGNEFTLALPNVEQLKDEPVQVTVKYPDGETAATESVSFARMREVIVIDVERQQLIVVKADPRAEEAKRERIRGKVVDVAGKVQIKNRQVLIWGKPLGGGADRAVVVAVTDAMGNFSGAWSSEPFEGLAATVAGTSNATPHTAVPIPLADPTAEAPPRGRLPKFVYIVVSQPEAPSEKEGECDCTPGTVPRQPDAEDLVTSSAYSQDIGLNCVNFTTPNRTLEEFGFTMVVRTTDPEIKGTTLSDLDRRAAGERGLKEMGLVEYKPVTAGMATLAAQPSAELKIGSLVTRALHGTHLALATLDVQQVTPHRSSFWKDLFKTVPERGPLNAGNSVDWDGTPTFYQATTIAHGHVLNFKQIWKADGYSLGDLVYSLPLAPGQKKQIVIFDWDRTEYGRRDEDTHEDEALNSYLGHNRDILEITRANVDEQVRGGSQARTSGSAGGVGGGVGALMSGVMIGVAGGFAASSGSASSSAWQNSSRDVAASGLSQLRDMVQQGASAVRNQRSTVVQTSRQTERFKVETEVVANHNHCHAITMQYFEVLRHYVIEQKLTHVQECLFIPLLMSAFDIPKIVRWLDILRVVLLLPPRRRPSGPFGPHPLVRGLDAAERIFLKYEGSDFPTDSYAAESLISLSGELRISFKLNRPVDEDDNANDPARQEQLITAATLASASGWGIWWPLVGNANYVWDQYFANQKVKYKNKIFEERVAPVLAEAVVDTLTFTAVSSTGGRYPLKVDTTLVSSYQRDVELYVTVRPNGAVNVRRDQIDFIEIGTSVDLSLSENSKIIVHSATFRYSTTHFNGFLALDYKVDNDLKPNDPVVIYTPLSSEEKRKPREEDKQFSGMLIEHLNANLEYYHKAIWQRMDPDRRYMLLDGFIAPNSNGKSVASVVENRVIGIAGNSLIMPVAPGFKLDPTFRYEPELDREGRPVLDEAGNPVFKTTNLLDRYQPVTPIPPFRVSVPTRGVFAECIMGACNACEKKDETRFWRWEESPNPDEPTPIAPVETMPPQRTDPGSLEPSPFPTPMINIQNAPPSPEPGATLAGTMALLGKSDLFPNITGLDQNQKNALQAMLSNQQTAKHFADKASELAVQSANLRSGNTTIESIKKSMDDGTLDKETGKKLVEDAYRAQISGKTAPEQNANSANNSKLGDAAASAVREGRQVQASQTHPDGTTTQVDQKSVGRGDLSAASMIFLEKPDPNTPGKWVQIPLVEGPGFAKFDQAFSSTGNLNSDFPARDSGRFRVVVSDPDFKAGQVVQALWDTTYPSGQSFQAGATKIDLVQDPNDATKRVSEPLVIVANKDDLPLANLVGTRNHARWGGMFGSVVIEIEGKRAPPWPILEKSKYQLLPMHILVVKQGGDAGTAVPAPEPANIAKQLWGAQLIYEPHGIYINSYPYPFTAAQASFQPASRTAGTEVVYQYSEIDIPATEIADLRFLKDEDLRKLTALFPLAPGLPCVRVFFVAGFDPSTNPTRVATSFNVSSSKAIPNIDEATRKNLSNTVFVGHSASGRAIAHEIGHVLMDKPSWIDAHVHPVDWPPTPYIDHYKAPPGGGYPEANNLMEYSTGDAKRRIWSIADGNGYNWGKALENNESKLLGKP